MFAGTPCRRMTRTMKRAPRARAGISNRRIAPSSRWSPAHLISPSGQVASLNANSDSQSGFSGPRHLWIKVVASRRATTLMRSPRFEGCDSPRNCCPSSASLSALFSAAIAASSRMSRAISAPSPACSRRGEIARVASRTALSPLSGSRLRSTVLQPSPPISRNTSSSKNSITVLRMVREKTFPVRRAPAQRSSSRTKATMSDGVLLLAESRGSRRRSAKV